jgi:Uma2 family endonuclease
VYRTSEHDELAPRFTGMPLLVVEVLSQNVGRDTVVKAHRYAKVGLSQYWIVNPAGAIEVLVLDSAEEGLYRIETRLTDAEQTVKLADGLELTIDPLQIFAP